jgi:hypothetical protein
MSASKSQYFDLKNFSSYFLNFIAGIAVESAAVVILMIIAYCISALGFWML